MTGNHAPVKPKKYVKRGGSVLPRGHGNMKFTKAEKKAAKRELNRERYGNA